MWAQRLCAPGQFELVDVADPPTVDLRDGQILLRTLAGGICGSDMPRFRGHKGASLDADGRFRPGPPGYPMHEVVGEVVASRDPTVRVGCRVVGWATGTNALAEFVVAAGAEVVEFDRRFDREAAVLVQSAACVLYAVEQVPADGARVAVLGLGPIGLLFAHVLRSAGARHVTGIDPVDRSDVAEVFGLDTVVHSSSATWSAGVPDDRRPDLVVEAVGHQTATLRHAMTAVAVGGVVLYFGIPDDDVYPLDMERLMRKNLTLIGGVTRRRREMLARADAYLATHRHLRDALVTHVLSVKDAQQAFDIACRASPDRRKVLITVE